MKHLLIALTLIACFTQAQSQVWQQIGQDIDGEEAGDVSGRSVSLSSDGNTVAIGAHSNDDNGTNAGHVRIYNWNGTSWIQLGQDIDGEAQHDYSGHSVSMSSDGNTVAIGAYRNDGNGSSSGHVRIYNWNGSVWLQKGTDIDGEALDDDSGYSVSMSSDGNTVAIGAKDNDGNGNESGHVRIYDWNGSVWQQKGQDIDGEAVGDRSGNSVSMSSDGNTVAIGAFFNDGNGNESGHVRIYDWNGSVWLQKGEDIDGEAVGDRSGYSVSMSSDGNTIAIGGNGNDNLNGGNAGHVRIYDWNGSVWLQKGEDIDGEAAADRSGQSVSLSSDGQTVAIGAYLNDGNGDESGHVRIYVWNGSEWFQMGQDIDGEAQNDLSGISVSMSSDGNTIAIGAHGNDENGSGSGHVRVYELDNCGSFGIDFQYACDPLTWIDGNTYTENNTSATHILTNAAGCDSVVTLNFQIVDPPITDEHLACGSFTWTDGNTYTQSNNTATYTVINSFGCEQIVTLDLTIIGEEGGGLYVFHQDGAVYGEDWVFWSCYDVNGDAVFSGFDGGSGSGGTYYYCMPFGCYSFGISSDEGYGVDYTLTGPNGNVLLSDGGSFFSQEHEFCDCLPLEATDVQIACDSYTWIDGNTYTENNNTATDTLNTISGCDSIVTLNLAIINSLGIDSVVACDSYIWVDGNTYTESNNTATYPITNIAACDSGLIDVTLDLTILNSSAFSDFNSACNSYTWIDGNTYTESNNTATHLLTNDVGCDSVISLNLEILNTSSIDSQTACDSFTWIDGNTYTESNNTATYALTNAAGCDSIITLDLEILNTSSIDSQTACDSFTWIDGNTYTESNNTAATYILTNSAGCDSIVSLDLTFSASEITIWQSGNVLVADPSISYQWVVCPSITPIIGATDQSYTATENGQYAVITTNNLGCVDTSVCYSVTGLSVVNSKFKNELRVHPNPTEGNFYISLGENRSAASVTISDLRGRVFHSELFNNGPLLNLKLDAPAGLYLLRIESGNEQAVFRLVKE